MKKYRMLMCFVRLLLEAFPFFSKRIELLLYWNKKLWPVLAFLALVLLGWVLPQLDMGCHEECQDHQSQLVGPELHLERRVLPRPLLVS
jgi:hypothetical protein